MNEPVKTWYSTTEMWATTWPNTSPLTMSLRRRFFFISKSLEIRSGLSCVRAHKSLDSADLRGLAAAQLRLQLGAVRVVGIGEEEIGLVEPPDDRHAILVSEAPLPLAAGEGGPQDHLLAHPPVAGLLAGAPLIHRLPQALVCLGSHLLLREVGGSEVTWWVSCHMRRELSMAIL